MAHQESVQHALEHKGNDLHSEIQTAACCSVSTSSCCRKHLKELAVIIVRERERVRGRGRRREGEKERKR